MGEGSEGQRNWLPNPTQTLSLSPGPCPYPSPRCNLDAMPSPTPSTQPSSTHPQSRPRRECTALGPQPDPAHPAELTWRAAWAAPQRGLRPQDTRPRVPRRGGSGLSSALHPTLPQGHSWCGFRCGCRG